MTKNTNTVPVENKTEAKDISKVDLSACSTTSAKIRVLNAAGFSTGAIAKFLDKRYQHVRNVLITPVKTAR
jgi:hypothetical protein